MNWTMLKAVGSGLIRKDGNKMRNEEEKLSEMWNTKSRWEVKIIHHNAQSFCKTAIFEGTYFSCNPEEVAKSIAEVVTPYWENDITATLENFSIKSNDKNLEQLVITEVARKQPKIKIKPEVRDGYSIYINFVEEGEK